MRRIGLATLTLISAFAPIANADNNTSIQGEAYQPTVRECRNALENGNIIPLASDNPRVARAYVFYDKSVYLIITQGGGISCRAWSL